MKIELVPATLPGFDGSASALINGLRSGFADPGEGERDVQAVLSVIEASPRPTPWGSYWAYAADLDAFAGLCAFKAAPDGGKVEIAYYTFPLFEGRGVATAMVALLVDIARSSGLKKVRALTLPTPNASNALLTRAGFAFLGPAEDPEDGAVWAGGLTL